MAGDGWLTQITALTAHLISTHSLMLPNNNNNFFILGKQIYNKIVAKIIKNNRIPKIKQTKYNIINRTKMLNRLVFHLTDQYQVQQF